MSETVYFVDDEEKAGELFARFSRAFDYELQVFRDADAALAAYRRRPAAVVISDLRMPGKSGLDLLAELNAMNPEVAVIMITGYGTVDNAVQAMKLGAVDFIRKPFDMEQLALQARRCIEHIRLKQENRMLRRRLSNERERFGMLGKSAALRKVQGVIEKIADVRCHVIIEGESGVGKELVARAIHSQSPYADKPFVVIDCGALSETLLESELFGHEKGAFTGAAATKRGLLEAASGGTVFLDEIGNISDAMQTRLLRVVQENHITRVGGLRPLAVDLRFVVATHRDTAQMVRQGALREDLYHRLHVVKITLPPLRERTEDIPLLVEHFTAEFARRYHRDTRGFDAASMRELMAWPWPGNIRELKNLVERHVALAEPGETMRLQEGALGSDSRPAGGQAPDPGADWPDLKTLERRYIDQVLRHTAGNRERAAAILGVNKSTLWRKLK